MKFNKWTLGLAAVGAVSLTSVARAEETQSPVMTALSSTVLSGYVDVSAHWNIGDHNGFNRPGYSFTPSKDDGFNLNVVKITLERPLDEAEWAAGYKVDLLFGPDAVGYNPSAEATSESDFAIKQAYVALRAPVGNGIDFKFGVFDTIVGYEVFESGNNPNYTRSYGYTWEPTQHTGILASYQINEYVGLAVGVANTLSSGINNRAHAPYESPLRESESYKAYMGSITLTAPDSFGFLAGGTLYAGVVNGWDTTLSSPRTHWYVGSTIPTPVDGLRVGLAYDYSGVSSESDNSRDSFHAHSVAGYVSYQITEKMSGHLRAEWAKMSNETIFFDDEIEQADEVLAITATLQYDLWANVLSRLEVRWDHSLDDREDDFGFDGERPFADHDRNAVLVAGNIIYKF